QATNDWVLCLDADERVSPELAGNIQAALAAPVSPVYRMPRRNRFLGRWLAHGEGYPDWSPRLFNRLNARWSDDLVHEKVLFAVTPGTLQGDLLHDSSDELAKYLDRQNRYTTLAAREVVGVDNLSAYYSVELKRDRLKQLAIRFDHADLADAAAVQGIFAKERPQAVLHLAAQPGVRYSLENPAAYVQSNLVGFANLLECCRSDPPRHLVFASSSSVYGNNPDLPWSERHNIDHPLSLYAATKKSNE